jgi:hypothetical protein
VVVPETTSLLYFVLSNSPSPSHVRVTRVILGGQEGKDYDKGGALMEELRRMEKALS